MTEAPKFVADENPDNAIYMGLLRQQPDLDIVRVQEVGLSGADDPVILEWAAREERIIVTHNMKTMPAFAYEGLAEGKSFAGLIVVRASIPISQAIEELLMIANGSSAEEWVDQFRRLPL